jgi:hypothetical protein
MAGEADPRLSAFRKDIDRLAREVEALSGSFDAEARLAGEEVVGAELLATRDLVAHLSILWETAEQMGDLYARQFRYWVDDNAETLSALVSGAVLRDGGTVLGNHLERRITHLGEGMTQSAELLISQSAKASETLFTLWKPFLAVLRADWAGRRNCSDA